MGAVYSQLSITERRRIERWRHAKVPVNEMARVLGRCRSTIFRELKRNHFSDPCMPKCDGYYGAAAQLVASGRRARERKLIKYPGLTTYRLTVIEQANEINPNNSDYFYQLTVAGSFDFSADAETPAEVLALTGPGFDDIFTVSFATNTGAAMVFDDVLITV